MKNTILALLATTLALLGQPTTPINTPHLGVLIDRVNSHVIFPSDFWEANAEAINGVVAGGAPSILTPLGISTALGYSPASPTLVTSATNDLWTAVLARPGGGGPISGKVLLGDSTMANFTGASSYTNIVVGAKRDNIGLQGGSIGLPDRNGLMWASGAQIWDWNDHDNKAWGNELQILGGNKICFASYWADNTYAGADGGGFQMGGSGPYNDQFWFQYNTASANPAPGWSKQIQFRMRSGAADASSRVVMFGRATDTTSSRGRLEFWTGVLSGRDYTLSGDGMYLGGTTANGWIFKGGVAEEHATPASASGTYAWDWNKGRSLAVNIAGDTTFSLVNAHTAATNHEERTLLLEVNGAVTRNLGFPAGWRWFSASGPGTAPTSLTGGTLLRIQTENLGGVICARADYTAGSAVVYDADAEAYFARASITDGASKVALNTFTTGLKGAGIWAKLAALYPMYGSTPTATAQNLVSSSYAVTWAGALASGAAHTAAGVVCPGGSEDYGNIGVNSSTPGLSAANLHLMVWNKSTVGTGTDVNGSDAAWAIGSKGTPYSKSGIYFTSTKACLSGPCAAGSSPSWSITAGDMRGYVLVQGGAALGVGPRSMLNRSAMTPAGGPISDATLTATSFHLFNYCEDGVAGRQGALTLAGASVGQILTTDEESAYYTLWSNLQSALGR